MNPKLSSSTSVVKLNETILEFFKSNTRQQVRMRVNNDMILNIVCSLDGQLSVDELSEMFNVNIQEMTALIDFLAKKGILDLSEPHSDFEEYNKFRRVIHFFSDFAYSHSYHVEMWNKIRNSTVLIIGLGAVGSWVASILAQSGVRFFILMDPDIVDKSNLHRQFGFNLDDVGSLKTEVVKRQILMFNSDCSVKQSNDFLSENTLEQFNNDHINLIINCADKPTVDQTSLWVGEYAMKRNIPHIVGGGYNLHLSLIGQTIIPGECACVKCFEKSLNEKNKIDTSKVKKLAVRNRKIGSFGPMCSIIASFIGMEAIKVLSNCCKPANINRRGEFDIYSMDITYNSFERRKDCEWCGQKGKYINNWG